jgi:zinc protease
MGPIATYPFGSELRIERHRLENGLEILVVDDPSAPVISYQTWFAVGSRHERAGKTGIAHLFEHLMFNETDNLPYGEYDRRLEEAGADNNACTYLDWTFYLVDLPKQALELTVELEAERMEKLVLREPQVESEREVVSNERRETVDDDVEGSVAELLYATAFEVHSYRFPTIGLLDDIAGLTIADCEAFYATHYAPNNAKVVVVGDVRPDELVALVEARYGHLKAARLPEDEATPEPPQDAERRKRVDKPTETVRLVLGYKSPAMADADHVSLTLLNEVLFGGRGSRVHQALVDEWEVASEVSAFVGSFRDPSLWEMHLSGAEGETCQALEAALEDVLARLEEEPVTEAELARACNRLELSALQDLESSSGKAESIGFSEIVLGDPAAQLSRLEAYRAATTDDLRRVVARYLDPNRRTVIEVVPSEGAAA